MSRMYSISHSPIYRHSSFPFWHFSTSICCSGFNRTCTDFPRATGPKVLTDRRAEESNGASSFVLFFVFLFSISICLVGLLAGLNSLDYHLLICPALPLKQYGKILFNIPLVLNGLCFSVKERARNAWGYGGFGHAVTELFFISSVIIGRHQLTG
ncbi:uncharacterized protein P884DRAFT_253685 [Thermothelomyces heterothallicus CBS 202.75]|uniref:uncharacterized protein n=1 Tax=Thermothelomyces heterothallicus CBS 202.75 TaxID=1149848 RepID=UPI003741F1A8